jgi:CRISPR system Cascade subunit CasD
MDVLILKLEAPLMSFGTTLVDNNGVIARFPAASLLTGLLANALGYDQGAFAAHQRLQTRLRFAARIDRDGQRLVDFQTVDLGQPFLRDTGWTTRGQREDRRGGSASTGTHIRLRHYWADRRCIVACALRPEGEEPTLAALAAALERPARPLFLGRKCCLPSTPVLAARMEAQSLLEALQRFPDTGAGAGGAPPAGARQVPAQWPADEPESAGQTFTCTDERDWANQFHSGARTVRRGLITIRREAP